MKTDIQPTQKDRPFKGKKQCQICKRNKFNLAFRKDSNVCYYCSAHPPKPEKDNKCMKCRKYKLVKHIDDSHMCTKCRQAEYKSKKKLSKKVKPSIVVKRKEIIFGFLVHYGCIFCNEPEPICWSFHHKDKTQKLDDISGLWAMEIDILIAEIEKCYLVCQNCHRKIHCNKLSNDQPTIILPEDIKENLRNIK